MRILLTNDDGIYAPGLRALRTELMKLGEVSVVVEVSGTTGAGQGVSTDIIDAAARAYVRALSVAVSRARGGEAIGLPETAAG